MTKAKPFDIAKREVWEAFKRVKANRGAAGGDQNRTDKALDDPARMIDPYIRGWING